MNDLTAIAQSSNVNNEKEDKWTRIRGLQLGLSGEAYDRYVEES